MPDWQAVRPSRDKSAFLARGPSVAEERAHAVFAELPPAVETRQVAAEVEQGVLGAMAGVMGSLAAVETIRALLGFGEDSAGKLLVADALTSRFRSIKLPKDPGCSACRG